MIKRIEFRLFAILSLILTLFLFNVTPAKASMTSKAECSIELNSLRVLSETNKDLKLPMASTTKILTALTVIENFDLDTVIQVDKKSTNIEGSSVYLKEGEHLTVKELLYGLMLRSGNDCAECLASSIIPRAKFIDLMNETAIKCGAKNSNFVNPHGLHAENHYTTAYDLALITAYALKNETFKEIVSTKKINISNETENYDRVLITKNKLLSFYEGANGVKTGYTKKAGRCLVSSATKGNMTVVTVVLNSPEMWERSVELLDYCFSEYKIEKVISKSDFTDKIYHDKNKKPFLLEATKDFIYPLKESEKNELQYKINGVLFDEFIKNPQKNGVFEIYLKNKLIFSQNIYII